MYRYAIYQRDSNYQGQILLGTWDEQGNPIELTLPHMSHLYYVDELHNDELGTNYKTLTGKNLTRIDFQNSSLRFKWIEDHPATKIYDCLDPVTEFLHERFWEVNEDPEFQRFPLKIYMYDIETGNVKKGIKFFLMFLFVGVFFLGILLAILIMNIINYKSLDSEIMSNHVEINTYEDSDSGTMYSPTYYYNIRGKEYKCSSQGSSSIMPSTKNRKVYFDSKNPSRCMTDYSRGNNKWILLFLLLPIVFISVAVYNIIKVNKRIKLINELNTTGKLVKNLPYRLENTGMSVNGVQIQRPVVDYTLPSGTTITLQGDPRHDKKVADKDGMVDLIIDEANPNNYFIDFEINRLSGNLPTDYYTNDQIFQNNGNNNFMNQQDNQKYINNNINNQNN